MPKSRKQSDLDPWEQEETSAPDPWEMEDDNTPVKARPKRKRVASEDAQERMHPNSPDSHWPVKYDKSEDEMTAAELNAAIKRERFLEILSKTGSAKKAAAMVKLTERALYKARKAHADFDKNWQMALEVYYMFEAEEKLRIRAIEGTLEPIVFQGRVTGYKRVYSDGLSQFWYKHNMRDKYGDKTDIHISGNINHGVMLMPAKITDTSAWEAQAKQTLDDQTRKMIDITPVVEEVKPVATPVTRIER